MIIEVLLKPSCFNYLRYCYLIFAIMVTYILMINFIVLDAFLFFFVQDRVNWLDSKGCSMLEYEKQLKILLSGWTNAAQ